VLIVLALMTMAAPEDVERTVEATAESEAPRTYVNFRVGAATSATRPQLCLGVSPLEMVALEGCGTGGGFLHSEPGTDITHFRGKVRLASLQVDTGEGTSAWVEPWIGAGFAELEVGADTPGFSFEGASAGRVSTAGPDVGASLRGTVPLGAGFEAVVEVGVGVAFFAYAPLLVVPQDPVQPQATINLGLGW
jgi:hypothetical protein